MGDARALLRGVDEMTVSAPNERVDSEALPIKRHSLPQQFDGERVAEPGD